MKKLIQYLILSFSLIISVSSYANFVAMNRTGTTGGEGATVTLMTMCAGFVPHRYDITVAEGQKTIPYDPTTCTDLTVAKGNVQFPQYFWENLEATFHYSCPNFKGHGPVIVTGHCQKDVFGYCTRGSIRMECPNN